MKKRWIKICRQLSAEPGDFYASARKILRNRTVTICDWKSDITLEEIGYTNNKLNRLIKDYLHVESRDKAVELWAHFVKRGSYASTCFTTHNHLVKSGATSPSETVETRGPCLQAVVITLIPGKKGKHEAIIDTYYRTTEIYKKFPADLLLLDVLLKPFDFSKVRIAERNFHFSGVTVHPMYCIVPIALTDDPVGFFEEIRKSDPVFYRNCVSWTSKYLITSRGIKKFEQAKVVQRKAIAMLKKTGTLDELTAYIQKAYDSLGFKG